MAQPAAVELRGLAKRFGSCIANESVSLTVARGSIHGIVGENGAGKSTAMNMLFGLYRPDAGSILIDGVERRWSSAQEAIAAGIGMVHQHFMLSEVHTGLDNVLLGSEPATRASRWLPKVLRSIARKPALESLNNIGKANGLIAPLETPVGNLDIGSQQRLEILKSLYRSAKILILDEPTAVLTPIETEKLFTNLRRMRDEGRTILIITHKLREVLALADHITVFRGGKVVGDLPAKGTSPDQLASLMVGRNFEAALTVPPGKTMGEPVLTIRSLSARSRTESKRGKPVLQNIEVTLKRGEIVGIAGVEGNGQRDLVTSILNLPFAPEQIAGTISLGNVDISNFDSHHIRTMGVAVIPEDRHQEGLLLDGSIEENILFGRHREKMFSSPIGFINRAAVKSLALKSIRDFDIRPANPGAIVGQMSGGNQQKVLIARELERGCPLIIAAQPTRGVDIGAIQSIHDQLVTARDRGAAVLLISSDLEEVMKMSDRILVMYEGRFVKEFQRHEADESTIGLYMGGGGS